MQRAFFCLRYVVASMNEMKFDPSNQSSCLR